MWLQPCPACQAWIPRWNPSTGKPRTIPVPQHPQPDVPDGQTHPSRGTKLLPLQVVKKSCYPRWNETFEFELAEPAGEKLCVEVWDWDLVGRNDFLGKVSPKPFQCC